VSVEDNERSGRPSTRKTTENVEKIRELMHEDCRRTIRELAGTVGISFETLERKCAMKKTGTLAQPQLAPSSRQHSRTHVPENHSF
jgi:hypothetical protein